MKRFFISTLIVVTVLSVFSCSPKDDEYWNKKFTGYSTVPFGPGSDAIFCAPGGDNCHFNIILGHCIKDNAAAARIEQNIKDLKLVNYKKIINSSATGSETVPFNTLTQEGQYSIFRYYLEFGKGKLYFSTENWNMVFPELNSNESAKNLIMSNNFGVEMTKGDGSIVFLKIDNKDLSVDNVFMAFKALSCPAVAN